MIIRVNEKTGKKEKISYDVFKNQYKKERYNRIKKDVIKVLQKNYKKLEDTGHGILSASFYINTVGLLLSCLLLSITYFLFQNEVNIYKVGNVFIVLIFAFVINRFTVTEIFQQDIYYISYLYLLLLFLKTLATYFAVQFSNFQLFFNFFVVSVVFIGVSSFYSFNTLYIFLAGLTTALFTTLITFMFVKIRLEYELTTRLASQIYIFDFMLAFIASLYIVDSLNVVNGLF